jgi:hypothetical protein
MDMNELIEQLQAERYRIDAAIKLLSGSGSTTPIKATGKRKMMSVAGRKRISEAIKKRWAAAKKKGA